MVNNPTNIGEIIRENRLKLGYTQEYLANKLNVTSQAVSKWEKGLNMPDVNLLIPLSKALKISIEQLLGGDRYSEYEREFQKAVKLGDKIILTVCEKALDEFPDDQTFLYRRACSQLFLAEAQHGRKYYFDRAIADFERLCEKYPDFDSAKEMLARAYFERGDRELAIEMAVNLNNRSQIARFIGGEEEERYKQSEVRKKVIDLCVSLIKYDSKESLDAARVIADKLFMDDRILNANVICGLYIAEAKMSLKNGDTDGFCANLEKAYKLAYESSKNTDKLSYGVPIFDKIYPEPLPIDELESFLNDDVLKLPEALPLKRRIVSDGVFSCRPLLRFEWGEFFRFCENHINENLSNGSNVFNFGTGWDMTDEQRDGIGRTLMEYDGNADLKHWDIEREYVETLINNRIMQGYVAEYNGNIFAYCNCKEKSKYVDLSKRLCCSAPDPIDAKILAIVEVMVSKTYKGSGIEERLISKALEQGKILGYTHAEIYPLKTHFFTKEEFEARVEMCKAFGFEMVNDLSNEYRRCYRMQKKL